MLFDIVLPLVLAVVSEQVDEQLRLNGNPFDVAVAVVVAAAVEVVEDEAGLDIVELLLLLIIGVMVEELFELGGVER